MYESLLVKLAVLPEGTVHLRAKARSVSIGGHAPSDMSLIEQCDDLVAFLEPGHILADGLDDTSAVRARDDTLAEAERILALGNNEVTVV